MYSALLSVVFNVHIIFLVLKGMIKHYIRKTILSEVKFIHVIIMKLNLRTISLISSYNLGIYVL